MSKHENALRAALLRLNGQNPLPVSAFTPAQRRALERFGQQTGAVQFLARGSGGSYRISNPAVFALHLRTLSPEAFVSPCQASRQCLPLPRQHRHLTPVPGYRLPPKVHRPLQIRQARPARHLIQTRPSPRAHQPLQARLPSVPTTSATAATARPAGMHTTLAMSC